MGNFETLLNKDTLKEIISECKVLRNMKGWSNDQLENYIKEQTLYIVGRNSTAPLVIRLSKKDVEIIMMALKGE